MNDIALSGLAKQLVLAGLLTEKSAQQAYQQAQRDRFSLVSYLVQNKLVKSRQVAEIACEHFGMALLDLHCLDKDIQPKGLVSEKLVRQHHALPLWRRGNKLFVGVCDPTNHQAINDVQYRAEHRSDPGRRGQAQRHYREVLRHPRHRARRHGRILEQGFAGNLVFPRNASAHSRSMSRSAAINATAVIRGERESMKW
jgi:hypothetical protein